MSDFNFAPDRWEFWRELPDPDDEQYEVDYDECDEYHDELIADRRRRRGEGWRNPEEDEEEEEE